MSMKWAVPMQTMKESHKLRQKREKEAEVRVKEKLDGLKYCPDCETVYKKADFMQRKYRNIVEDYFPKANMPTIGLDRKQCLVCEENATNTI